MIDEASRVDDALYRALDMPERATLCKELREMEMSETRSEKVRMDMGSMTIW